MDLMMMRKTSICYMQRSLEHAISQNKKYKQTQGMHRASPNCGSIPIMCVKVHSLEAPVSQF